MFKVTHDKYLEDSLWQNNRTGRVELVEVWKHSGVCGNPDLSTFLHELTQLAGGNMYGR